MMIKQFVLFIVFFILVLPAFAAQPQLIKCSPANGETNVPLDIEVIRFYFDQNMKMNQWTFWMSDKGEFPPMATPDHTPWRDPVTCELLINTLEPNTTYAVQLNSTSRQGFRSAKLNEPLPITIIVFKTGTTLLSSTGKSESDLYQSHKEPQQTKNSPKTPTEVAFKLLTAYKAKDLETMADLSTAFNKELLAEIKLSGSEHPRYKSIFSGHRMAAVNAWDGVIRKERIDSESQARVTITDPDQDGNIIQVALVKEKGIWRFEDLAFDEVVVKIQSHGLEAESNGFDWKGNWVYDEPGLRVEVTFHNSNRFTRSTITGQQTERAKGRYTVDNDILELKEDTGDVIRFPFRIKDLNTFEVQDEGEWVPIYRQ